MADSYSSVERLVLGPFRRIARAVLLPLVWGLARAGIPPNAVSLAQIPIGAGVWLLIPPAPRAAWGLFVGALILDGLDGALARHTKTASTYGALVDQVSDHVREITVIAALGFNGLMNGGFAALYALAYPLSNFMLYLGTLHGVRAPLALKTWLTFYPLLFAYLWFGVNWLDYGAAISVVAMGLVSFWQLFALRGRLDS